MCYLLRHSRELELAAALVNGKKRKSSKEIEFYREGGDFGLLHCQLHDTNSRNALAHTKAHKHAQLGLYTKVMQSKDWLSVGCYLT